MKERPILFSAPMVRALLDGRKTQTRRVMKTPVGAGACENVKCPDSKWRTDVDDLTSWFCASCGAGVKPNGEGIRCPYGVPGDRLWVREAFTYVPASAYRMSEGVQQTINPADPYEAAIYAAGWDRSIPKWKPSIHMPRWASRILLEITDVRVERLKDISEADAIAEGIARAHLSFGWDSTAEWVCSTAKGAYREFWESINGPGSWDANPWVWVVEFKLVTP